MKTPTTPLKPPFDYKMIHKWLKNGGIDALQAAFKAYYPNVESLLHDVLEIDPELSVEVFDWCIKNNKHVGHFLMVSAAKQRFLKKQPFVLHGPAGTGKTTIARQIARELGYRLVEINASDVVDKNDFPHSPKSITGEKLAILFDEADRGTPKFYKSVLTLAKKKDEETAIWTLPVIFAVNYYKKFKFKPDTVAQLAIEPLPADTIASILYAKAKELGLDAESAERIDTLACNCNGDVRQAINVLKSGNLVVDHEVKPMDVAMDILTKEPNIAAKAAIDNYESISYVLMILSANISGGFAQNVLDYRVLSTADRLKYKINKDIIASLISVIDKKKKVKLAYPKSYKPQSDDE